ncbi:MAG: ribulose-phosphate 3-epimerase [Alphaproteobacteria bacterium]|nr:ribulose-phosphate 3-epimerase [Alphaproteobacteria bacterium]
MQQPIRISPSMLAADFACLGSEIRAVTEAGADYIHLDVMDGHFVPNLSFGPDVIKAMRPYTDLPFDVHLMIGPVAPYIPDFVAAGADIITVHPEADAHVHGTLQQIKKAGKKAGIALNPGTPVEALNNVLELLDLVLVMTVNPGFGGQTFIDGQLAKISAARRLIDACDHPIDLSVDGGIKPGTAARAIVAGADVLVAGTSVFRGEYQSYAKNITQLRNP